MRRLAALAFPLLLAGAQAPPERPERAGLLRIATSAALAPLIERAAAAYRRGHPGLDVRIDIRGSDIAMALLYTGHADLAVTGRRASEPEVKAYEWIYRHRPVERPVFAGSTASLDHSPSIAVLVNAASPVSAVSPDELRAIYLKPGRHPAFAHAYLPDTESGTGRFLRHALFADATLFAWAHVRETTNIAPVARDRRAIALAAGPTPAGTKRIALRVAGRDWTVRDAGYPLARTVYAYGADGDSAAAGFIDFLAGPAGQALVQDGVYRRLNQAPGDVAK